MYAGLVMKDRLMQVLQCLLAALRYNRTSRITISSPPLYNIFSSQIINTFSPVPNATMYTKNYMLSSLLATTCLAHEEGLVDQSRRDYFYVGGNYVNMTVSHFSSMKLAA